jgi:hypothetical protein
LHSRLSEGNASLPALPCNAPDELPYFQGAIANFGETKVLNKAGTMLGPRSDSVVLRDSRHSQVFLCSPVMAGHVAKYQFDHFGDRRTGYG